MMAIINPATRSWSSNPSTKINGPDAILSGAAPRFVKNAAAGQRRLNVVI